MILQGGKSVLRVLKMSIFRLGVMVTFFRSKYLCEERRTGSRMTGNDECKMLRKHIKSELEKRKICYLARTVKDIIIIFGFGSYVSFCHYGSTGLR